MGGSRQDSWMKTSENNSCANTEMPKAVYMRLSVQFRLETFCSLPVQQESLLCTLPAAENNTKSIQMYTPNSTKMLLNIINTTHITGTGNSVESIASHILNIADGYQVPVVVYVPKFD